MTKKITILGLIIAIGFGWAQTGPKNLLVMKPASKKELKMYMERISDDLGVKGVFCHNMSDKSSDQKKHKLAARSMMKMTRNINTEFLNWDGADQVTCWTCHQGQKEPPVKE